MEVVVTEVVVMEVVVTEVEIPVAEMAEVVRQEEAKLVEAKLVEESLEEEVKLVEEAKLVEEVKLVETSLEEEETRKMTEEEVRFYFIAAIESIVDDAPNERPNIQSIATHDTAKESRSTNINWREATSGTVRTGEARTIRARKSAISIRHRYIVVAAAPG